MITVKWTPTAMMHPLIVSFSEEDRVLGHPITDAPATLRRALARTVLEGVHATRAHLTDSYTSAGGIPRKKTRPMRDRDIVRLETVIAILDYAFEWRGEWGSTPSAIASELIRRANPPDPVIKEKRS